MRSMQLKKALQLLILSVLLVPMCASAAVIDFTDTTTYMPTWQSSDYWDNYRDTIENPDITGGSLTLDGNTLTEVSFDNVWTHHFGTGDLFIDKDNNGFFDYVLNNETSRIYEFTDGTLSSQRGPNDDLYHTSDYYMKDSRHAYREGHYVSLNMSNVEELMNDDLVDDLGSFTGEFDGSDYFFLDLALDLAGEGEFSLSFSPLCANDVISTTSPVPVPSGLFLLSGGILGLIGIRRRKVKA